MQMRMVCFSWKPLQRLHKMLMSFSMKLQESCQKLNLHSNLLGCHLQTDLQTVALLQSQIAAHERTCSGLSTRATVISGFQFDLGCCCTM
jgi:hypothetical protein